MAVSYVVVHWLYLSAGLVSLYIGLKTLYDVVWWLDSVYQLLRKEELLSQQERELQHKEADIQSAKRGLAEARGKLQTLERQHEESCRLNSELEIERYGKMQHSVFVEGVSIFNI